MIVICLLLAINDIIHSQSIMGGGNIVLAFQLHTRYVLPSCEGMELKLASVIKNSMTSACKKSLTSLDRPVLGSTFTHSAIIFPQRFYWSLSHVWAVHPPSVLAESLCCPLLTGSSDYNSSLVKQPLSSSRRDFRMCLVYHV